MGRTATGRHVGSIPVHHNFSLCNEIHNWRLWRTWIHNDWKKKSSLSHNMTDTDLADNIALISDNLDKSQLLLERDEPAATEVGLYINSIKTEYMACTLRQQGDLATLDNSKMKQVDDFPYLGAWLDPTKNWKTLRSVKQKHGPLNKLTVVWKSNLSRDLNIRFFRASFESVLLYSSESLTLIIALK